MIPTSHFIATTTFGTITVDSGLIRTILELPDGPLGSSGLGQTLGRAGVSSLRWVLDAIG